MTRASFTIVVACLCTTAAAAPQPPVAFESPCECRDNHGKTHLAVKEDRPLRPRMPAAGRVQTRVPSPRLHRARACLVTGADAARPPSCDSQHRKANDLREEIAQMVKLSKWWKTAERARSGLILGPVITGIARNSEAYDISRVTPNRPRAYGQDTDWRLRLREGFTGLRTMVREALLICRARTRCCRGRSS